MSYNPIETFYQEAEELLSAIEQAALALDADADCAEIINDLFRAFHTIKGSGAMCGLDAIASFTHRVEGMLDGVRSLEVGVTPELPSLVLAARDHITALLAAQQGQGEVPEQAGRALLTRIDNYAGTAPPASATATPASKQTSSVEGARQWRIEFHPEPTLLTCGTNLVALFAELARLGECTLTAHDNDVPELDEIEPERCYLYWTATLRTTASYDTIRDVFIFVEDGSQLRIEADESAAAVPADIAPTKAHPAEAAPPTTQETRPASHRAVAAESTVRVPASRLDRLVNLVGELVMNQSHIAQAALELKAAELANPVQELERLVDELRDNVLGIRMLPISTLFGRFKRLVHDLSHELGKEVVFETEGGETELDKSILDQLGEPFVHLVRNSIDHGIEAADVREAAGKPRRGTVRLRAAHTGSAVVVSIEDDGRGLDRAAILAKAVERGLIDPAAKLSDKEIFNLILLPGFSTARTVSRVSGRGVGMDVVKRQIDALRGALAVASEPGRGTRIEITLPLTLAIIDGLLVEVGSTQFIAPMAAVFENVELTTAQRQRHNQRNLIMVRNDFVPYIDLRNAFRLDGDAPQIEKVVIVQHDGQRVGLVVDRVVGTHQTVIQSLGKFFRGIEVVSGGTIMGDGRVALILDIAAVVRFVERRQTSGYALLDQQVEPVAC